VLCLFLMFISTSHNASPARTSTSQLSFRTFAIADFSISSFTLSATFSITVVSFTFAINP